MLTSTRQFYTIYIHVPFCRKKCAYCDFHFSTRLAHKSEIVSAICKEIALRKEEFEVGAPASIYFGGGTPSLLDEGEWSAIFETLFAHIPSKEILQEVTIETNPEDIVEENIRVWKKFPFNRFSLGVQSLSDSVLVWMNRGHDAERSLRAIKEIQNAGWNNVSVDYILGVPDVSTEKVLREIEKIAALGAEHMSVYILAAEPKTALHYQVKTKKIIPLDDELIRRQFLEAHALLASQGFDHYEISNYAKNGKYSLHNSSYWNNARYIGLGPSAHSYDGIAKRKKNIANNTLYAKAVSSGQLPEEEEMLGARERLDEYIMIGLRTQKGFSLSRISSIYGEENYERIKKSLRPFLKTKWLIVEEEDRVRCSLEGWLFSDSICAALFS